MPVTLNAHYEWLPDDGVASWWADSPDLPGFYVAASTFARLQREAEDAARWTTDDESQVIDWAAVDNAPAWLVDVAFVAERMHTVTSGGTRSRQTFWVAFGPNLLRDALARLAPGPFRATVSQ